MSRCSRSTDDSGSSSTILITFTSLFSCFVDLLERQVLDIHHHGDARQALDLGGAHGERFDVEAAAREQPGDSGQQTRLVLDEERKYVRHVYSSSQLGRVVARVLHGRVADALRHHRPHHGVAAHDEVDHHRPVVGLERELDGRVDLLLLRDADARGSRTPPRASRSRGSSWCRGPVSRSVNEWRPS